MIMQSKCLIFPSWAVLQANKLQVFFIDFPCTAETAPEGNKIQNVTTTTPQSPHSTTIILNPLRTGSKPGRQNSREVVVADGEY